MSDGSFEVSEGVSTGSTWTFKSGGSDWYQYGGGGEEGYLRPYESDGTVKPGTSYPDGQFTTTYQAYLHEKIYNEIVNKLLWAWCSYVWQLFDSASDKKQGGLPGTNDKGLIAFDHETKKDAFYFYKANWNDIEPFVHIVGTTTSDIIRAYSNYDALQLYVNDEPFGEPITDVNTNDGVVDGMGVFMWYGVPEGEIRTTTLPIGDIAEYCGYSSQSNFQKAFRRVTGQSPVEYRNTHKIITEQ